MRQFRNIAVNAFMELIRQPIFLLLLTGSVLLEIFTDKGVGTEVVL